MTSTIYHTKLWKMENTKAFEQLFQKQIHAQKQAQKTNYFENISILSFVFKPANIFALKN